MGKYKIIDLACGARPVKEADVFTDKYIESSKERKAHKGNVKHCIPPGKPLINCDIHHLPFKDKTFDYVYARQILEHVDDPIQACNEIMRIGKAGIIISPTIFGEIFFGWPYHKWMIIERGGELFFFEKRKSEDRKFGSFFRKVNGKNPKNNHLIIPQIKKVYDEEKHLFDNFFEWKDRFKVTVVKDVHS